MKLVTNLSKFLEKGKITQSEFERFMNLSQEGIPNFNSDIVKGFGWVCVNYGFLGFYIDSPPKDSIPAGLFEGLMSIGLGLLARSQSSDRLLFTTICFVFGALMIVLSTLQWVLAPWQP